MSPGRLRLFLYDDRVARSWQPFSLTRPAGEMLFGTETLRARIERVMGVACSGHLAGDDLLGFEEPDAPRCTTLEMSSDGPGERLYLNSRFVPDEGVGVAAPTVRDGAALLTAQSTVVGALVPEGVRAPAELLAGEGLPAWPEAPLAGEVLHTIWGLMASSGDRIRSDGARFEETRVPAGVHVIGSGPVSLAQDALVEPGVVLDVSAGPVIVSAGARVHGPARIVGPTYVGPGSVLLGGVVAGAAIGPQCRVRGEVDASVILGFANKAHDGYLGRSIVGRWVNLGAMTSNSDLKNTYGVVRLRTGGRDVDTGLLKVGCFLGDHVRTGIGTLLNSGTVVGAGSSLFGGGMPARDVPPFSWCGAGGLDETRIDGFLETASRVMARRGVSMTDGVRRLYRRAFSATAPLRSAARPS